MGIEFDRIEQQQEGKTEVKSESISDQKRLVRAEQWIFARKFLRIRDGVHHGKWRILMVAGPSPQEEIVCIRELMHKAKITAVDIAGDNLIAASKAGCDETIEQNLLEFDVVSRGIYGAKTKIPGGKLKDREFDAVCLDLTGPASEDLARLIGVHFAALAKNGVLIVSFSYGRDIVEVFDENWRKKTNSDSWNIKNKMLPIVEQIGMPDHIRNRVIYLLDRRITYLRSAVQYRGAAMPMVSLLMVKNNGQAEPAKFTIIDPEDYEEAVLSENLGNIYACPADRIAALRRKRIAQKAVATREMRRIQEKQMELIP